MDAALVVTSTTTSAARSCLLLSSLLMRENPDTAESKYPVGEDEADTSQSGNSTLYSIKRTVWLFVFELTIVFFCDDVELMGIFLCA